ncbi:unnamed protein product [Schistosoma margrebowiei]|uniref:Uncharacterized protein n=1 Tax=Schistosoma margrebowiei TaxID=48269 RepID=A0AA84Z8M1_9TREM|nr:unnamed protein product [Schistosoma margrebowiei]
MPFHKGDKSGHFDASQNTFNLQDPGFGPSEGVYNNRMDPRYGNMNPNYYGGVPGTLGGSGMYGQDVYNRQPGSQGWNTGRRHFNGSDSDDSDIDKRNHGGSGPGWNRGRHGSHSNRRGHSSDHGSSSDEGRRNRHWR